MKKQNTVRFENIPQLMKDTDQWILWKEEEVSGRITKVPYSYLGYKCSVTESKHFRSFETVKQTYEKGGYSGIGFVLTEEDNFLCIDLDDIDDLFTPDPQFEEIMQSSYTEISPSGNGTHTWFIGKIPEGYGNRNDTMGFEVYEKNRFITTTGDIHDITGHELNDDQALIDKFVAQFLDKKKPLSVSVTRGKPEPVLSDDELSKLVHTTMEKALNNKITKQLYHGEWEMSYESQSEADFAFCKDIAKITPNYEVIEYIFTTSSLMRDKWNEKRGSQTYGEITIENALLSVVEDDYKIIVLDEKKRSLDTTSLDWIRRNMWIEEEGKQPKLLHDKVGDWILTNYHIKRYKSYEGELYYYDKQEGVYVRDKGRSGIRAIVRAIHGYFKVNQIREIVEYVTDKAPLIKEPSADYFGVGNGLINIHTAEFRSFTPDVFITSKITTNYKEHVKPNDFVENTLDKVSCNHPATKENVKEMFACVVYPEMLVDRMFYLYGKTANNGKSTVLKMIQSVIGIENYSSVSLDKIADNTFATSAIYGKLANIVDDLPNVYLNDIGNLKSIVTGETIQVEQKGKDSFVASFDGTSMVAASNFFPQMKEHGKQVNRRLYILPFEYNFDEDKNELSKSEVNRLLESEATREYVLNMAINTLKELLQRVKSRQPILTENDKVKEITSEYEEQANPLADFLTEYPIEFFEDNTGRTVLEEYAEYCKGTRTPQLSVRDFKEAVAKHHNMKWVTKRINLNGNSVTTKGFKMIGT